MKEVIFVVTLIFGLIVCVGITAHMWIVPRAKPIGDRTRDRFREETDKGGPYG